MNVLRKNPSTHTPYFLSLCCIIKEEDDVIEEWVAFHLAVGVDRILLIDNGPSPNLSGILAPYIQAGKVDLRRFQARGRQQQRAYDRAIRHMASQTRWLGLIDADEFLFPTVADDLPSVLKEFDDYVAVSVNWVSFGSSGHETAPSGFVIENFTERGELDHRFPWPALRDTSYPEDRPFAYKPMNSHVKTILDPARTIRFRTAHHYRYLPGLTAVTENGVPIDSPTSDTVSVERLRINHYWSKSREQIRRKIAKGDVASRDRRDPHSYALETALGRDRAASGVTDRTILRFLPRLRSTIDHYRSLPLARQPSAVKKLRYRPLDWIDGQRREIKRFISRARRGRWGG